MTQVNIEIPDDIAQEFYRRAPLIIKRTSFDESNQ